MARCDTRHGYIKLDIKTILFNINNIYRSQDFRLKEFFFFLMYFVAFFSFLFPTNILNILSLYITVTYIELQFFCFALFFTLYIFRYINNTNRHKKFQTKYLVQIITKPSLIMKYWTVDSK